MAEVENPSNMASSPVACPVCTLYLREGISLQKHLDTHPKEQVIEALIKASLSGNNSTGLSASLNTSNASTVQQSVPVAQPSIPSQIPSPQQQSHSQITTLPHSNSVPMPPSIAPGSHVPTQPTYQHPVAPMYDCPPVNPLMPSQFSSFSYQQFVNNGTMMIPAQYAMAQAHTPQPNQMMQMMYNPYGMYHQQQIPAIQMFSPMASIPTPPTSSALTLNVPTSASPPRVRASMTPVEVTASQSDTSMRSSQACLQQTIHEIREQPKESGLQDNSHREIEQISTAREMTNATRPEQTIPVTHRPGESESEQIFPEMEPPEESEPEQILPPKEPSMVTAEKVNDVEVEKSNTRTEEEISMEHQRKTAEEIEDVEDNAERILPDIEDNQEIESLVIRNTGPVISRTNSPEPHVPSLPDNRQETLTLPVDEESDRYKISRESVKIVEESNKMDISGENQNLSNNSANKVPEPESTCTYDESIHNEQPEDLSSNAKLEIDNLDTILENMMQNDLNLSKDKQIPSTEQVSTNLNPLEIKEHNKSEKSLLTDNEENNSVQQNIHSETRVFFNLTEKDIENSEIMSDHSIDEISDSEEDMDYEFSENWYKHKFSKSTPASPTGNSNLKRTNSLSSLRLSKSNVEPCIRVPFKRTTLKDFLKDNYDPQDMEIEEFQEKSIKTDEDSMASTSSGETNAEPVQPSQSELSSPRITKTITKERPTSGIPIIKHCMAFTNVITKQQTSSQQPIYKIETDLINSTKIETFINHQTDEKCNLSFYTKNETITSAKVQHVIDEEDNYEQDEIDQKSSISYENSQEHPANFGHQAVANYSTTFALDSHLRPQPSLVQESFPSSHSQTTQNLLNLSESMDPSTSTDSKNYSPKTHIQQKPSAELLNINEDAHAGPMNVFEFDGLQILVPSTFITESSQKAVSGTSHHSMSNSENGICNDEEIRSVNMRADEIMPPRGELSEQESNGCTEQSTWQMYMGQESSRMSTSYDLMARESWEESEGSDNEAGPLLDSRSLATHFTSSLFLDRDRKTPTRRIYKCNFCPEMFECPKERRVHSSIAHKEPGSSTNDQVDHEDLKDIKLLENRSNVFEDIFAQGLHVQQAYHHIHQQPLLHQLQPPQHLSPTKDRDNKLDTLNLSVLPEYVCNLCNQRFTSDKSLQQHQRRVHIVEPIKRSRENAKCQICNEEFNSVAAFNLHLKIHPLECGQCGKYFYRKQNFKLHMKRHLGIKPFPCTICDKAFLTKQKLDEHMNGHTGNAPVKCNLCNETFRRYSNLTQHKNRHHLNIKKKLKDYICHCGEVFHTKKKLAWHKETHDEKPKSCSHCNERFVHMASLTRHMRRAHNRRFVPDAQRENENVECPICKCIYLRSSLAVHLRVHNGERPYECQVCSKSFSTKWNLQLHKWTHAARSTKPFKCNQCSAAFYRHSDYTAHMNSHRNVRPYTCNYCGAQFIRKYNCLRHVKEHEENKQYTCDVCNKTFHRSYYLKEHLRVHSGARPYTCHICGKSSSTKSNHNKHVRIHHAREPVNTEN